MDENIPMVTVESLRAMHHEVRDIRGTGRQGMLDTSVWELAQQEKRLLLTTDKYFVRYRDEAHHGILIVRLKQPNRVKIHERIMKALAQFGAEDWPGLMVVSRDAVQVVARAKGPRLESGE